MLQQLFAVFEVSAANHASEANWKAVRVRCADVKQQTEQSSTVRPFAYRANRLRFLCKIFYVLNVSHRLFAAYERLILIIQQRIISVYKN